MARPFKEGLEYFPLDVDMGQDDKIFYIETKHGPVAFAVIVKLLMRIYKNSYYTHWTEKEHLMFSRQVNVDINTMLDIVNDCIEEGLFDKGIYSNQGVLTSKGIQSRYLVACTRRKQVEIDSRYLLVDAKNYPNMVIISKKAVNVSNNIKSEVVNVDINPHSEVVNAELSTQRKVKESKVKNKDILSDDSIPKKEKKSNTKFNYEPEHMELAELLYDEILKNNPNHKKPDLESWANSFRLTMERDKRTFENLKIIIQWCQSDSFWYTNILSADKLRKQYDQLSIKMEQQTKPKPNQPTGRDRIATAEF